MTHRPAADAVVQIEQAGLVGDFGRRLGRNQSARRGGRDRRLGIARALADEAAGADRAILHFAGEIMSALDRGAELGAGAGGRIARRNFGGGCGRGRGFGLGRGRSLGRRGGSLGRGDLLDLLLLLARLDRGRTRFEPEAMRLADHRIAADPAELLGDLAGGRPIGPHRLEALDALVGPAHVAIVSIACCSACVAATLLVAATWRCR